MAYVAWSVVFGETPSASKWNILGTNDSSFNDGTGIGAGAIAAAALASGAVTPAKLALGGVSSQVATSETTTSTSFAALATAMSVSATIGANGMALVGLGCWMQCSLVSGNSVSMSFVASGANSIAAGTSPYIVLYQTWTTNAFNEQGRVFLITGLTPGATTFAAQFLTTSGTGTFKDRNLFVLPL